MPSMTRLRNIFAVVFVLMVAVRVLTASVDVGSGGFDDGLDRIGLGWLREQVWGYPLFLLLPFALPFLVLGVAVLVRRLFARR